jgi:7-cyano-7-deazaguanine synthase in queuosine biosynthesis
MIVVSDKFSFDLRNYKPNLALLFSGGADSTLLFYLSALEIIQSDIDTQLTLYVLDRYNKPLFFAHNIFEQICSKLGTRKFQLNEIRIPDLPNNRQISVVSRILHRKGIYGELLIGANKYPDDETIRPHYQPVLSETEFIKIPFRNYTKELIIDAYFKLGIEDILYNTRSCGMPENGVCKMCFNCREREWAFRQLGKEPNFGL